MIELKIDPEFENLIPKLTDAEYAQLEKNILADGKVKEPIVVWDGTIVDGHHRYHIVQKHPELDIPFQIEKKDFANKHEAMAWACANQLGRRNLSKEDASYLRGTQYNEEVLASGAPLGNQNAKKKRPDENRQVEFKSTRQRIAAEHHVSEDTIKNDGKYARGMDTAEEVVHGFKESIRSGEVKVPKYVIEEISDVTPDKQRKAVLAISDGDVQKAKDILEQKKETLVKYGLNDDGDDVSFTVEDLLEEITENFNKCMESLKTTILSHKDIIDERTSEELSEKLSELFNSRIKDFMEEI